jgi:hypothetical protein
VAQAPGATAGPRTVPDTLDSPHDSWLERLPAAALGAALIVLALAAYWLPGYDRFYNHFVWQAAAFLQGHAAIDWPVQPTSTSPGNASFQDVLPILGPDGQPSGHGLLPFPPLPAIVLMPFVALFGLATDIRAVSAALGAIAAGIAWWALGWLRVSRAVRLATTIFFAFGTVFWYAAQLGTTWFFAHVVAVAFALLAVGLALKADPAADEEPQFGDDEASGWRGVFEGWLRSARDALVSPGTLLDRQQVLAGVLFGLACTARLTVVFGAPFFLLVGGGGSWLRRGISAGIGTAIPVGLLLAYNLATTGQVLHPGYEYLYAIEARGYPSLGYHPEWAIEDSRYLPQNAAIMLLNPPAILPDVMPGTLGDGDPVCTEPGAGRGLFDEACPIAVPRAIGMSLILTSPAYLLGLAAFRGRRSRVVVGAVLAVAAIALVNLMHFSQGWVQFGYRFSNDFVPFALPLVAVGMARRGGVGLLGVTLVAASVAINLWGVIWGNLLGW